MVAVGADLRRTCTCTLVRWDKKIVPDQPREVRSYRPQREIMIGGIDLAGKKNDPEVLVVTVHYFDGTTPCATKR